MNKIQGHVKPKQQAGTLKGELDAYSDQLAAMVEQYPDATFSRPKSFPEALPVVHFLVEMQSAEISF